LYQGEEKKGRHPPAFLRHKEAEANEQHISIIGALKAAAPKWEFEQIDFVVGNRGSVLESDF